EASPLRTCCTSSLAGLHLHNLVRREGEVRVVELDADEGRPLLKEEVGDLPTPTLRGNEVPLVGDQLDRVSGGQAQLRSQLGVGGVIHCCVLLSSGLPSSGRG